MKTNLKRCPFCGSKAHTIDDGRGNYYVECDNKDCSVFSWVDPEDVAIKSWNTRYDEMTLKKVLLLIPELAIKILALAVTAGGVYWIFA